MNGNRCERASFETENKSSYITAFIESRNPLEKNRA